MAQPAEYNRRKDFTDQDGDDTDHNALNQEFDAAALSINQIRTNLALLQNDDGSLKNGLVGKDQLAPDAFDAFQADLDEAVGRAVTAADESTRSAVASAESQAAAALSEENAARSESNAASSANAAASAAQYAFNGIYFGPHSDDPALDPNGNPPTDGDFYYNTVAKTWRVYDAQTGRWVAPILSGQFKRQIYAATTDFTPGVTDVLALPSDPLTARNIFIHFDGIFQQASTFTLVGLNVEFDAPIPVGVNQVEIAYIEAVTVIITDALMSFATRAIAQAAVASIADGQAWEIRADENYGGKRTRGIVDDNVLVLQSIDDFADDQVVVKKTGNTGAAILPEGLESARPDPVPADGLLVRGNKTTGKPEWYNRVASKWQPLDSNGELFHYAWHNGPRSSIDIGRVATDGQQLLLLTHPDVCQAIWDGKQNAVDDSEWQADPTKRNCWSRGDGTSWVRVPDLNAAVAGTGKSFYLRGGPTGLNGTSVGDAIRNITASLRGGGFGSVGGAVADGAPAGNFTGGANPLTAQTFDASRVVPTADENRVKTAYGVWTVRVFTEVGNVGALDAGQLATQLGVVDARVQSLDADTGCVTIYPNGTEGTPGTLSLNTNVVVPNPFPGYKVFCELEVLYGGQWCGIGMSATSTTTSVGAECKPHNNHASLIVQGGITSLIATTNLHYFSGTRPTSGTVLNLPFRLVVWKLKGGV